MAFAFEACPPGWLSSPAGACYDLTRHASIRIGCVPDCNILNASLSCLMTSDVKAGKLSAGLDMAARGDVWFGLYRPGSANGWGNCSSAGDATNWADHAAALPNMTERCDREMEAFESPSCSSCSCGGVGAPDYLAFAQAEKELFESHRTVGCSWVLILLLVVPVIALAPQVMICLCARYCCCAARSAARSSTNRTRERTIEMALPDDGEEGLSRSDAETVKALRMAEQTATRLWSRVKSVNMALGWAGFGIVMVPQIVGVSGTVFRLVTYCIGHLLWAFGAAVPWSMSLFALAIRPIDNDSIQNACNFLFVLVVLAILLLVSATLFLPIYTRNYNPFLVSTSIGITTIIATFCTMLWPTTTCGVRCQARALMPRQQLLRFWFVLRFGSGVVAVYFIHMTLLPAYVGERIIFAGGFINDLNIMGYILPSMSYATVCFFLTPSVRGRFQLWLASRLATARGSKEHEASLVAALIGANSTSAADAYLAAKGCFRGTPPAPTPCPAGRSLYSLPLPLCRPIVGGHAPDAASCPSLLFACTHMARSQDCLSLD